MLVDLSHDIEHGMVTYPGLPEPVIGEYLSRAASRQRYAPGTEFHIGKIEMVANTGTYVDAPFHRHANGADLAAVGLDRLANVAGTVVRATSRAVGADAFANIAVEGKAVLVHTGWDRHWRTEHYARDSPFLTRDAAQWLRSAGASLVGIDSMNIDDVRDLSRPVHTVLLAAGIPIVEHLCNLGALPSTGWRFFAVPPRVRNLGTFPVRAFAIVAE